MPKFLPRAERKLGRAQQSMSRKKKRSLVAQVKGIVACDFFSVGTVLFRRLRVLFRVELDTRAVQLAGVTANPVRASVSPASPELQNATIESAGAPSASRSAARCATTSVLPDCCCCPPPR
ncbi:MAG: hypothetical protein ACYDGN_16075 [Acidimicrobiales bacterium]